MAIDQKLQIIYRKVEELVPYEKNSRTHSEEQIEKVVQSIQEFGWTNPILIDEKLGIIAGHGRLEAAKRLGMEEVPVIELTGLTAEQKRAYIIADNQLALEAGWDEGVLKEELSWLKEQNFSLEATGFDESEIETLLSFDQKTEEEPTEESEEEIELQDAELTPPVAAPKTRRGDLFILGEHRLLCGDSTNEADVARLMGGGEVICI